MTTLLSSFVRDVYAAERDLRPSSLAFIHMQLGLFARFLQRAPTLQDLSNATINAFLDWRLADGRSRETARGSRAVLRGLWQHAFDVGLMSTPPQRLKKLKRQLPVVEAWDCDEISRLLAVAKSRVGSFRCGVRRADYWEAVVRTLLDTGLRVGDLLSLDSHAIRGPGVVRIVQRKTSKPVEVEIGEAAWSAIARTQPLSRRKIFGDVLCRGEYFRQFKELCVAAGLNGRSKMLRRSSGSLVEREHPGEGHAHLGHGREVFQNHYNAMRISRPQVRRPRFDL